MRVVLCRITALSIQLQQTKYVRTRIMLILELHGFHGVIGNGQTLNPDAEQKDEAKKTPTYRHVTSMIFSQAPTVNILHRRATPPLH